MQGHCTDQANDILNCPAQCWRASFAQTSKKKKVSRCCSMSQHLQLSCGLLAPGNRVTDSLADMYARPALALPFTHTK